MDSLVSTAPSPWLKMERGLRTISQATQALMIIVLILVAASFLVFVRNGVFDLTWIGVIFMVIALRGVSLFCEGAMERLRQLSQLV